MAAQQALPQDATPRVGRIGKTLFRIGSIPLASCVQAAIPENFALQLFAVPAGDSNPRFCHQGLDFGVGASCLSEVCPTTVTPAQSRRLVEDGLAAAGEVARIRH